MTEDGTACGPARWVADLAGAIRDLARTQRTLRWVWPSTAECYPPLLRSGVRLARCHDIELTEALLLGAAGRWGEPRSLAAAFARLTGAPVPEDASDRLSRPGPGQPDDQQELFPRGEIRVAGANQPGQPTSGIHGLEALVRVVPDQHARCARCAEPGRMRMLIAAESAGALAAVEMGLEGLPLRVEVHERVLLELLGSPSAGGGQPRRLVELTQRIVDAFGGHQMRPDSPAEVLRAFSRIGITLPSTRAGVLRQVDHPAVPLLLEYKELYRIWTAHGWTWRRQWVRDGRFHPEYVAGGAASGRWATRGGGALQIPRAIRSAVIADPGWVFVAADAGQLEPRILAAVSGDRGLAAAAGTGDLYEALAAESFGGDRAAAKVALLGAMYGQTGGQAAPALAVLRQRYPTAWEFVEAAARAGEAGGLVRSWLGRTCPPPPPGWGEHSTGLQDAGQEPGRGGEGADRRSGEGADRRARGRFTRNFVIQATAAEWALVLLARARLALAGTGATLVFFQHDEIVAHCPAAVARATAEAMRRAGDEAGQLLFGASPVRFPLDIAVVECYGDAKGQARRPSPAPA
ncbi:MAG: bifunctional 3'-5' exonuclease/DNA polymerase [Micromonosporaceae bacterium]|nr:bifunctional 3'-5' exonuclease/DNA polymerase [Micromonosporaceae bacterium]